MKAENMKTNSKQQYNEIFLAVIGTSPAVLSECLYYYHAEEYGKNRRFSEIKVITTGTGRRKIVDQLLGEDNIIRRLEKDLKIREGSIPFSEEDILVPTDPVTGIDLEDFNSTEENDLASRLINMQVKKYTDDDCNRVTASIAGGRKTQSAMMALAFQFFGRAQDEVMHILVNDALTRPGNNWFYPNDPTDDEQKLSVSDVPVLKIGRYLSQRDTVDVSEIFQEIQEFIIAQSPIKEIVIEKDTFSVDGFMITLPPKFASFYRYFLRKRKEAGCDSDCEGCEQCFASEYDAIDEAKDKILKELGIIVGVDNTKYKNAESRINEDLTNRGWGKTDIPDRVADFQEAKSRIKTLIQKSHLNPLRQKKITLHVIKDDTSNLAGRTGVRIDPQIINFKD